MSSGGFPWATFSSSSQKILLRERRTDVPYIEVLPQEDAGLAIILSLCAALLLLELSFS